MIFHILNGDALAARLKSISGEQIIMREALIEGPLEFENLNKFLALRAKHFESCYQDDKYHSYTTPQLLKLKTIKHEDHVILWFEEDLFCQANLWFLLYYLIKNKIFNLSLVLPNTSTPYSFANMSDLDLKSALKNRTPLQHLSKLTLLWKYYSANELSQLSLLGNQLEEYPFIARAITAQQMREAVNGLNHPQRVLLAISKELKTQEFAKIFPLFCLRASIYGYGDFQVKRLWDNTISQLE